jgi:hypothetical protein
MDKRPKVKSQHFRSFSRKHLKKEKLHDNVFGDGFLDVVLKAHMK